MRILTVCFVTEFAKHLTLRKLEHDNHDTILMKNISIIGILENNISNFLKAIILDRYTNIKLLMSFQNFLSLCQIQIKKTSFLLDNYQL